MTQTLSPRDTGEIRLADPGQTTTNLTYVTHAPLYRRPDATTELPVIDGGCRTVVPNDEDFDPGTSVPMPDPLPLPPPPTPAVDDRPLSDGEEIVWQATYVRSPRRPFAYAGRHRPGWHGTWRRFLADALAPLARAW